MGYGETGAPEDLQLYGFKAHSDAIAGIAKAIGVHSIILGGHDWGGAVVYRVAQWEPKLVSHVFSIATPYFNVSESFVPAEMVVKFLPNFGYQLQFGSEDSKVEKATEDEEVRRKFLTAMYGGKLSSGRKAM
jgi:soluble epoxide hydrolase/lipid-phosphate phosphatase